MAIWIEDRKDSADSNGNRGSRTMISYGADSVADLSSLPPPNGSNEGSSCFVLENSSIHILGSNPSVGVNGWRQI